MRRIVRLLVVAVVFSAGFTGLAGADGSGGANNVVLTSNTVDDSTVSRSAVQVAHDPGDTVANSNIASAKGWDCDGCRTVSVAMQVVLVEGDPSDVEPANVAAASNGNCTGCETFAFAYQYVVQPGQVVYLTADAQRRLSELRSEVSAEAASSDSYDTMTQELDALFAEIVQTINDNLQTAGTPAAGSVSADHRRA